MSEMTEADNSLKDIISRCDHIIKYVNEIKRRAVRRDTNNFMEGEVDTNNNNYLASVEFKLLGIQKSVKSIDLLPFF